MENQIEWRSRYSFTDEYDDMGRWARIAYYKGLQIGWCNRRKNGIGIDNYLINTSFPSNGNDSPHLNESFDTYEECQQWISRELIKFINHIFLPKKQLKCTYRNDSHNCADPINIECDSCFWFKGKQDPKQQLSAEDFFKKWSQTTRIYENKYQEIIDFAKAFHQAKGNNP